MSKPRRRRYTPPQPQVYPFAYPSAPVPQVPAFKEPPRASVQVLRDKNATVANVTVSQVTDYTKGPDYTFETSGSTKREQGDRYDPQTGDLLAIGRAMRNAGNEMIREANKRVADLVTEQQEVRDRAAQRRANKAKPVKRRTKAEWDTLQRRNQDLKHEALAWGASREITDAEVLAKLAKNKRIGLASGRYLEEKDGFVGLYNENGTLVMTFDVP